MEQIAFSKMSGSGNDFILIDNRVPVVSRERMPDFARKVCTRRISIGGDGVIFIEDAADAHFRWRFFNADGSVARMCGNGARCAARFAFLNGIAPDRMRFETRAGLITATVAEEAVRIGLTEPDIPGTELELDVEGRRFRYFHVQTGVPHAVVPLDHLEEVDVGDLGRAIRHHPLFQPEGTNVTFMAMGPDRHLDVRTYERGVEGETMACGTGAVAAALVMSLRQALPSPVKAVPKSGEALQVYFERRNGRFVHVALEGNARLICTGTLMPDAWNWGAA